MSTAQTLLRIPLSEELLKQLTEQAAQASIEVEDYIARKLPQIAISNSTKPIVVSDDERRVLERLLGKNMLTGGDLIKIVERAMNLSVAEASVPLTPYLLDRLKSRCFGMPFDRFMALTVKRLLEEFAGIR